ncbi:carboxypeptidase-like regulatory domain-containing protein [Actinoplanes sp. NPDC051861]|uniref:carboxypeptidase-like regulatory domain-containing protein n=1 Tax=Actinoplanes sp. NPDC051861 TaxID=3155170 RepID=UPI00342D9F7E
MSIRVSGIDCRDGCTPVENIQDSASFNATLVAPNVDAGQSRQFTITVTATNVATNEANSATENITVKGPDAPQTVRQVSGRIKSSDGERLSGVQVAMTDSAGHQYSTTTGGDGGYAFSSSDAQPIAPGNITVGAVKDGFQAKTVNAQAGAGKSVNVQITLKKLATESPSASPSASVSASTEPLDEELTDEETPTDEESNAAGAPDTDNASDDSGTNWLLIIMGVLLVAAGVGAFALVWLRRKNEDDEPGTAAATPGFGGPSPAGAGGFDATRVASPVGAARGGDATMVAPAGRMPGGIGDAPTMVHRPVEDEFPDPYGAPPPPQGGFGGGQGQWDNQGNNGYGGQQYGQQGGYGAQGGQGGYGNERYDEHTNLYQPDQPQRYDEHTNLYQPDQGGGGYGAPQGGGTYGGQGGQGNQGGWGGQDDGYGPQGGYDQQGGGYGGYDQQQGGYGDQGGYGGGNQYGGGQYGGQGQGQPGGYDQQQGGGYGGYDQQQQQQGGYGDQDGYYGPNNGPQGQQRPNRNNWDD